MKCTIYVSEILLLDGVCDFFLTKIYQCWKILLEGIFYRIIKIFLRNSVGQQLVHLGQNNFCGGGGMSNF